MAYIKYNHGKNAGFARVLWVAPRGTWLVRSIWYSSVKGKTNVLDGSLSLFDDGRVLRHHNTLDCALPDQCCVHHPSDHPMRSWTLYWQGSVGMMMRVCAHGVPHPDPDAVAFRDYRGYNTPPHTCDGCCSL